MNESQVLERIKEADGNTIVMGFSNEQDAHETVLSVEKLMNDDRITLAQLTRDDNYSVEIKARVK
ncbi:hypothetical protein [Rummeliibacillus sp. POC4]|uniref:hypothetical protein n=1 Tax=Rummeliibacillus sp. POC4 TaxID=2305899 RepID=UPI000E66A80D|nr:hypothetical protein [Rummeliibacillus sp. POC4]RIJ64097.1 hypothetical protein D1606_11975 [Rummeliibacillus sp. POC4]